MKVRWREYEMIFVTILIVAEIIILLLKSYNPLYGEPGVDFASMFQRNGLTFIYWKNALLPQIGSLLLIYFVYLAINLFIVPSIKKIEFNNVEKVLPITVFKPVIAIAVTGYLLALGINVVSYYAHPHLFNYYNYQLPAMLGYNDNPLTNLFFGFERAAGLVTLFVGLAGLREFIIWIIERPGSRREFGVLVLNNIIPVVFVYFLVLFFMNPIHKDFRDYVAWFTPGVLLYMYLTFWFFPFREGRLWWQKQVLFRLLLSTFAGACFSALVFSGSDKLIQLFIYWLFLLFIVTPFSWVLYLQRRDKILQLKGMELALAKSTSDLQFLRSQINPHFLFNALNTLYGTALKDKSHQTAQGIQMLGDMMRFMLHENNLDFIPMHKEIEYLKNYITLQKLRTPDSQYILIEDNIDEVRCNHQIAPMLLIPFVENAFKHGISLREKSWIDIRLECDKTTICFKVRNSIHTAMQTDTEKDKSGIGLKNVAERLKLLYPAKHELNIYEDPTEFTARLVIKIKSTDDVKSNSNR